jgi:predicted RNA-binding protein with EMAP domain
VTFELKIWKVKFSYLRSSNLEKQDSVQIEKKIKEDLQRTAENVPSSEFFVEFITFFVHFFFRTIIISSHVTKEHNRGR